MSCWAVVGSIKDVSILTISSSVLASGIALSNSSMAFFRLPRCTWKTKHVIVIPIILCWLHGIIAVACITFFTFISNTTCIHVHLNCAKCLVSKFTLLIKSNGLWMRCQDTKFNIYHFAELTCVISSTARLTSPLACSATRPRWTYN